MAYGLLILGYIYQHNKRNRLHPIRMPTPSIRLVLNKTFAEANINNRVMITTIEKSECKGGFLSLIFKFSLEDGLNDVNFFLV